MKYNGDGRDVKQANPPRTTATMWWIITVLALLGTAAPFITDMDGMNGGFALAFICFLLFIMGIIIAIIYGQRAKKLDRILSGRDLLAHWTYSDDEWKQYADEEYKRERSEKQVLFIVITVIALLIGIIFFIVDPEEGGPWVLAAMAALIAIIAFVAYFTPWYNHRQYLKYPGEVLIAPYGTYFSRQLHLWDSLGARLVSVEQKGTARPYIEFKYEAPTRTGMQEYNARVQVPIGRDREARELVDRFNKIIEH